MRTATAALSASRRQHSIPAMEEEEEEFVSVEIAVEEETVEGAEIMEEIAAEGVGIVEEEEEEKEEEDY